MGADLSYVNEIEDFGGVYKDSNTVKDAFTIFKNRGTNTVRVRLWHNPQWVAAVTGGKLYSDLKDVEKTIRRAKRQALQSISTSIIPTIGQTLKSKGRPKLGETLIWQV